MVVREVRETVTLNCAIEGAPGGTGGAGMGGGEYWGGVGGGGAMGGGMGGSIGGEGGEGTGGIGGLGGTKPLQAVNLTFDSCFTEPMVRVAYGVPGVLSSSGHPAVAVFHLYVLADTDIKRSPSEMSIVAQVVPLVYWHAPELPINGTNLHSLGGHTAFRLIL
jgi:hypothetical protein